MAGTDPGFARTTGLNLAAAASRGDLPPTGHMIPRIVVRTALAGAAALLPLGALPAQTATQDSAYAVITRLFDAMRTRDTATMRASFVRNASMQSLTPDSVRFESVDGWIGGVGRARAGLVLDERLANAVVHVDGDLANVWVDYWFFAGDRFSHCGVDAFLLARQQGRWLIFSVVDTRRTSGCPPPPPR